MKAEDLKFPLTLDWYGTRYEVTEGRAGADWTVVNGDGSKGTTYRNSGSLECIARTLSDEDAHVVLISNGAGPSKQVASISLSVDTTDLAKAVSLAKELEAVLLRIKGMLA